jgi:hypothetical protein
MNRLYWAGCSIVLLPVLGLAGSMAWVAYEVGKWTDRAVVSIRSLDDLERRLKLHFPPGTALIDGKAQFGLGGGNLGARVKIAEKALPTFLAQPGLHRTSSVLSEASPTQLPTEAEITAKLEEIASAPGKRATVDQIEQIKMDLMMLDTPPENLTGTWNLGGIRHFHQAKTYERNSSGLTVWINLDNLEAPIVYIVYYYT